MSGRKLIVAAALLALAQIAFLSWIIAGRAAILRDGQEVLLKVEPVDPRDLLTRRLCRTRPTRSGMFR